MPRDSSISTIEREEIWRASARCTRITAGRTRWHGLRSMKKERHINALDPGWRNIIGPRLSGNSLRPTICECFACMLSKLVGWGSNLHGQLGQDLSILHVAAPVIIDSADRIVCVTSTQVLYTLHGQMYLYGYMLGHDSEPKRHCVPWSNPRAILGQDFVEACLDEDGYLCMGISNTRCDRPSGNMPLWIKPVASLPYQMKERCFCLIH